MVACRPWLVTAELHRHGAHSSAHPIPISLALKGTAGTYNLHISSDLGRREIVSTPRTARPICQLRFRRYLSPLSRRHDKGDPGASLARKATGPMWAAEPPNVTSRPTSGPSSEERRGTFTGFASDGRTVGRWERSVPRSPSSLGLAPADPGLAFTGRGEFVCPPQPTGRPHETLPRRSDLEALRAPRRALARRLLWAPIHLRREHDPRAPLRWRRVQPAPFRPEEPPHRGISGNHEGARARSSPRRERARVGPRAVGELRATRKEEGRPCRHGDGVHRVHRQGSVRSGWDGDPARYSAPRFGSFGRQRDRKGVERLALD